MKNRLDDWPFLSAFIRLVLILLWYATIVFLGFAAIGILIMLTGYIGDKLIGMMGQTLLTKACGYAILVLLVLAIEMAVGLAAGVIGGSIMARWPDNPLARLIRWVKRKA
jgi:hypothetical protein